MGGTDLEETLHPLLLLVNQLLSAGLSRWEWARSA